MPSGGSPKQAELSSADLRGTDLTSANLSGAHLSKANLTGAKLVVAKLCCADLSLSNLTRADLTGAYLTDADLIDAKVTKAVLAYADLTNACYAPASEPPHPHVAGINGLVTVRVVGHSSVGLVQLRKLFQEVGLRDLERQATYSIQRAKTVSARTSAVAVDGLPSTGRPLTDFVPPRPHFFIRASRYESHGSFSVSATCGPTP